MKLRLVELKKDGDDASRSLRKCPACGGTAGTDAEIVTAFHPGDMALSAVVSDTLYQSLPERADSWHAPGGGRRLLIFSDNRQDAAFFAPYLQRTTQGPAAAVGDPADVRGKRSATPAGKRWRRTSVIC